MSLYAKALKTMLGPWFESRANNLKRPLTDEEVKREAKYQLNDLPYKGIFKGRELFLAKQEMLNLIKNGTKGKNNETL